MPVPPPPRKANLSGVQAAMDVGGTMASANQMAAATAAHKAAGGRALGQGIASAGAAIGAGIEKSKDPTLKAKKLQANAAMEELNRKQAASGLYGTGQQMTLADTTKSELGKKTGQPIGNIDYGSLARTFSDQQMGKGFYDRMPPALKAGLMSIVQQGGQAKSQVRPSDPAMEKEAGRYAHDPSVSGETGPAFMQRMTGEINEVVRQELLRNPAYAAYKNDRIDTEIRTSQARTEGKTQLADLYESTANEMTRAAGDAAWPHVFGSTTSHNMTMNPDGSEGGGQMTLRDWLMKGKVSVDGVEAHRGKRRVTANRFQIGKGGQFTLDPMDTPFWKSIKQKEDPGLHATMNHYKGGGGHRLGIAYGEYSAARQLWGDVLSGKYLDKQSQADSVHWQSLKKDVREGKIDEREAAHWISQRYFGNETPLSAMQGSDSFGASDTADVLEKRFGAWERDSKSFTAMFDRGRLGSMAQQQYQGIMQPGVQASVKGPLDFLDTYQIPSGVAAGVFNSFRDSMQKDPSWGLMDNYLQGKGLDTVAREHAMAQVYEPWKRKTARLMAGYGVDGKPVREYSDQDKIQIMKFAADALVQPYMKAKDVKEKALKALPTPSGQPSPFTRNQANTEAAKVMESSVGFDTGHRSFDVDENRRITMENGRVTGMKVRGEDGEWKAAAFAGDNPEDQANGDSLKAAMHLVRTTTDWSKSAKAAINWRMNGMGQNRKLLNTVLLSEMKDGTPLYEYTFDLLQHFDGDYAAAAQGIRKFMGQKAGAEWGQLVREVQEAGRDIQDPVLHTLEMLVSEGATPHKNTMRDIKQAETPIETDLIAPEKEAPEMDLETALNQRQMEITPDDSDFEEMQPEGYITPEDLPLGQGPGSESEFLQMFGLGSLPQAATAIGNIVSGGYQKLKKSTAEHRKKNKGSEIQYVKPWEKL